MSINQNNQNNQNNIQLEEIGGKHTKHQRPDTSLSNSSKKQNTVIFGKVYADWCGHCKALEKEWDHMKKNIHKKGKNKHIVFVQINEKNMGTELRKIETDNGVTIHVSGFPTLFRIENGTVKYYNGERTSDKMSEWFLRGGDPFPNHLQGGGRTYRRGKKRTSHRRQNTRKQPRGLLDLLFGK
jgi:thiol-disulfide isomerase/thioredoxin